MCDAGIFYIYSSPKLEYAILFNSSRALKFQQLIFGSPDKPDGRVGTYVCMYSTLCLFRGGEGRGGEGRGGGVLHTEWTLELDCSEYPLDDKYLRM